MITCTQNAARLTEYQDVENGERLLEKRGGHNLACLSMCAGQEKARGSSSVMQCLKDNKCI